MAKTLHVKGSGKLLLRMNDQQFEDLVRLLQEESATDRDYYVDDTVIAFLLSKIGNLAWYRVSQWKPQWGLGDPKDELIMGVGAVIGAMVALYYWRKKKARQYIEEVAEELSKVTWPSRKEVTNSTAVVVFTTLSMTVFFALMDQFWRYVTDKIYSF